MDSVIYERISLSNALNKTIFTGVTNLPDPKSIFEFDRTSDSVRDFRNFAAEVLEKLECDD
ncbi:MAG: hypothetical protein HC799_19695 [Limnothrix sp. RL_2_0]|nr:hypothetical protein [Limnothrix sp. RL_2_0]